jgi:hypothetical protein
VLTPQSFVKSGFPETAEVRRQRSLRSGKRAKITNRLRRQEADQPAAPPAPAPTPRRIVDPLGELTRRQIDLEQAKVRDVEREWRERLRSVTLKPERIGGHVSMLAIRPIPTGTGLYYPRRWPIIRARQARLR